MILSTNFPVAALCPRALPQALAQSWPELEVSSEEVTCCKDESQALLWPPTRLSWKNVGAVPWVRGCPAFCFLLCHAGPRAPPDTARGAGLAGTAPALRPLPARTPAPPGCRGLRHGTACTSLCRVGTVPAAHRLYLSLVFSVVIYLNIKLLVAISNIASRTAPFITVLSPRHSSCPWEALERANIDLHLSRVLPLPPLRKLPNQPATKYPAGVRGLCRGGMLSALQTGFGGYFLGFKSRTRGGEQISVKAPYLYYEKEKKREEQQQRGPRKSPCAIPYPFNSLWQGGMREADAGPEPESLPAPAEGTAG